LLFWESRKISAVGPTNPGTFVLTPRDLAPEKVDELKVEFCPIIRSRTDEEKSIQ
jgi:hypothetical protein